MANTLTNDTVTKGSLGEKTGTATLGTNLRTLVANEVSAFSRYFDQVIHALPLDHDDGELLQLVAGKNKATWQEDDLNAAAAAKALTDEQAALYLLDGNFNFDRDMQEVLARFWQALPRRSRIAVISYSPYIGWFYKLQRLCGLRKAAIPDTFFTRDDIQNIATLTGFELVRSRPAGFVPWKLFGLGDFLNRWCAVLPFIRWLSLANIMVLRPKKALSHKPSVTVVVPARNERGNIENAVKRLPDFGNDVPVEVIYVEGHSKDGTWEEIQRVQKAYDGQGMTVRAMQQTGVGKVDASRLGLGAAKNDLLMILDADLTMPPEMLRRYYDAFCSSYADFINGSRLVYPMEGQAMRTLNKFGNKFFAKVLSMLLDTKLTDTLCGTKVFLRKDFERIVAWRQDFGDVDPFGDFELLFPAAELGLGIIDIPIKYRDREYGSTQIHRFRHGAILLKMTFIGFTKIMMGRGFGKKSLR